MPWVEITTREPLADDVRANLARSISDTMETIEFGHPTENARKVDWMWFHTLPANMWAVGGQFDDTYVRGRKLAFARIIAPEGFMNSELKAKALSEVAKNIRDALAVGPDDDPTGDPNHRPFDGPCAGRRLDSLGQHGHLELVAERDDGL